MADNIASLLAWFVLGCLVVGVIGLLMPVILFLIGFGLTILAFALLAWVLGRIVG
jgi:hypothetical protein